MKRIKVIATMVILFSASLMNYHDHTISSVNFCNGSALVMCADSKIISKDPAPIVTDYRAAEAKPCNHSVTSEPGAGLEMSSGKNYEASMVIL